MTVSSIHSKKSGSKADKNGDLAVDPVALLFEGEPEEETAEIEEFVLEFQARPTVAMASHWRIGTYAVTGPITGQPYHINRTATPGIDLEDAALIADSIVRVRCIRTGKLLDIHPAGIVR